jgi:hypothetical protein
MKVIDLHKTTTIIEAIELLSTNYFCCIRKEQCKVIHGIGEGKLATAVHDVLNQNPLVKIGWKMTLRSCLSHCHK